LPTASHLPVQSEHPAPAGLSETSAEQALIESSLMLEPGMLIPPNSLMARLPVELDVAVPLRNFRVRNLLALERGVIVESQWTHGSDVPLAAGNVQLAWSEFEVVDTRLGVRLTRLT
jgi:flagellar motor switch/type III secretory pathway protein FliN